MIEWILLALVVVWLLLRRGQLPSYTKHDVRRAFFAVKNDLLDLARCTQGLPLWQVEPIVDRLCCEAMAGRLRHIEVILLRDSEPICARTYTLGESPGCDTSSTAPKNVWPQGDRLLVVIKRRWRRFSVLHNKFTMAPLLSTSDFRIRKLILTDGFVHRYGGLELDGMQFKSAEAVMLLDDGQ